jgi:hypothetical protein
MILIKCNMGCWLQYTKICIIPKRQSQARITSSRKSRRCKICKICLRICALCEIGGRTKSNNNRYARRFKGCCRQGRKPRICIGSAPSAQSAGEQSQIIKGLAADLRDVADKAGNQGCLRICALSVIRGRTKSNNNK